jgi:hypothetical protein
VRIRGETARGLVWVALAGQIAFVVSWVVAGALEPGYSYLDQGVSQGGARGAEHAWIVNAGLVVLGLSIVALGIALLAALPRRPAAVVATTLFALAGAAIVLSGFARLDCWLSDQRCEDLWRAGELTWRTDAHLWAGLVAQSLLVLTPFALARALWPGPVGAAALVCGTLGVGLGVATFLLFGVDGVPDGLLQRIGLAIVQLWVAIVALGILHVTRPRPRPGPLVPLRPREFFAAEWSGSGELLGRPFFLWRRLGQRFEAHRTCTWISDRVWRMDDEARFGHGRVQRRRMFCEFVTDEHVRITGGDMPEGADALIEEGGYRVVPFPVAFPIGPVSIPVMCHDVSSVEPDGTLANTFEARTIVLGILLARVTFRVKPVAAEL